MSLRAMNLLALNLPLNQNPQVGYAQFRHNHLIFPHFQRLQGFVHVFENVGLEWDAASPQSFYHTGVANFNKIRFIRMMKYLITSLVNVFPQNARDAVAGTNENAIRHFIARSFR